MSPQPAHGNDRLLEVTPVTRPPDARLVASPSKSVTHRAILMGLLSPHVHIEDPLLAADTLASLRLTHALGAISSAEPRTPAATRILSSLDPDGVRTLHGRNGKHADTPESWQGISLNKILTNRESNAPAGLLAASLHLHVEGPTDDQDVRLDVQDDHVDLGNSGTTLRLGTALAALADRSVTLTGDESLQSRPMAPLLDALTQLGAKCSAQGENGRPPIQVQGPLKGGEATLDGGVSSQYISAVLIAAHGSPHPITLRVQGHPASAPYIRLTIEGLQQLGGHVDEQTGNGETRYHVPADARLHAGTLRIPGDWSSAAFPLVAAAVTDGRLHLSGLDPQSPQGDRAVLQALERAGCQLRWKEEEQHGPVLKITPPEGTLKPFAMDLNATPDLLPPLGALAARCSGTSRFTGIAHARIKETDRIAATSNALRRLGFDTHEEEDSLEITGDPSLPLPATTLETHGDHRILMAMSVLALTGPGPIRLTHPSCYHVSYPRFRLDLDALGGATAVITPNETAHPTTSDKVHQGPGKKSSPKPSSPKSNPKSKPKSNPKSNAPQEQPQ